MGKIEAKLKKMGMEIPPTHPYPSPNRTSAVQVGNLLFLSGHGTGRQAMPLNIKQFGKVGGDVTEQEAYVCAKAAALCMLASIKKAVGDLDRVRRVVRLYGMVNCAPDFGRHMVVIDGASDLFYELWGPEFGQHARAAVGIAGLPRGAVLEIMGEFELHPVQARGKSKSGTKNAAKKVVKTAKKTAKKSARKTLKRKPRWP